MKRLFLLLALLAALPGFAHSGKARFHIVVDTDGAADDLRTLCLLLGNREAEVLAITSSEGAQDPRRTAACVQALLRSFHHEGIPVGCGEATGVAAPLWRKHSEQIDWGEIEAAPIPEAPQLLCETIEGEEEPIVIVAMGALTNFDKLFVARPALKQRIARIIWYNDCSLPLESANYRADPEAARRVLASGIPTVMISAAEQPIDIEPAWIDSIATVSTPYARKIAATHRSLPLRRLIEARHLKAWDDLTALYLFRPESFDTQQLTPTVSACRLRNPESFCSAMLELLRGRPDSESRVFFGFPTACSCYAEDVEPIVGQALALYGPSEWRAAVLTNELHGHLGIYATVGVKMGIRAREYFDIGVDDIEVTTCAGHRPPVSCMNDGLQVGTGATVGHGLIRVAECAAPRPEAIFRFKNKAIRLRLKPEYAERIRRDVRHGVELYGDCTEPYWQYIRELALRYWLEFDRHEIFDLEVAEP
ncbi:MAG: nucleoside hydrolase [Alistipes sp.]|nr:nucleoside hydrolase [Alistipes senegalensis]MCM1249826.1 nucleoside hydrolase [Alistipes sp.]